VGRHHRDAVGGEHGFRFRFGQLRPAIVQRLAQHPSRAIDIGREADRDRRRHLHQQFARQAMVVDMQEGPCAVARRREGGDARIDEAHAFGGHAFIADPAGEQGAGDGLGGLDHGFRDFAAVAQCVRRVHNEYGIRRAFLAERLQHRLVARGAGVDPDVDRVAAVPARRQDAPQPRHRFLVERRHGVAAEVQAVLGHDAAAAAVAHGDQAAAVQRLRAHHGFHGAEQLVEVVDAQDAGTSQNGIEDIVAADQVGHVQALDFVIAD
jgi:hypothetical protein